MGDTFTISFINDFGTDVRIQISAGPDDPAEGGCNTNPVLYDSVLADQSSYDFVTLETNVCWRRSSGPGNADDALPAEWNNIEEGNDLRITVKMSDQI
jgi:hypothetical protein